LQGIDPSSKERVQGDPRGPGGPPHKLLTNSKAFPILGKLSAAAPPYGPARRCGLTIKLAGGTFASNTTPMNPIIISSQL